MIRIINEVEVHQINGVNTDSDTVTKITVESHPVNKDWSLIRVVGYGDGELSDINIVLAVKTDDLIRAAQNSANRGTTDSDDYIKECFAYNRA